MSAQPRTLAGLIESLLRSESGSWRTTHPTDPNQRGCGEGPGAHSRWEGLRARLAVVAIVTVTVPENRSVA